MRRAGIFAAAVIACTVSACDKPDRPEALDDWSKAAAWDGQARRFLLGGRPASVVRAWDFERDGQADGFAPINAAMTPVAGRGLVLTNGVDAGLRSPPGLKIEGREGALLMVRMTRSKPTTAWDGSVFYETPRHGETEAFMNRLSSAPAAGAAIVIVYPMAHLVGGGDDWARSQIERLRIDLEAAGGETVIHQIALVREPV